MKTITQEMLESINKRHQIIVGLEVAQAFYSLGYNEGILQPKVSNPTLTVKQFDEGDVMKEVETYRNHPQKDLKIRLKLKQLKKYIDKSISWNFGRCPTNDYWFDYKLELGRELGKLIPRDLYFEYVDEL